jgi:hypothetical protein
LSNNGSSGIARSYQVSSINNSGLNASATFNYDATELNGSNFNDLMLYQSSNGGTNWNALAGTANADNVQSLPNIIESFSLFSLFSFDFKIDSLNGLTFHHGDSIKIYYSLNGSLNPGNVLKFEFSDTLGDFSSPFVLDSISLYAGSGILTKAIPATLSPGVKYRIRLKTTDISLISPDNGNDITILEALPTNVTSLAEKGNYEIYPNPASEKFYVKGSEIKRITVTDKLGRTIIEKKSYDNVVLSFDITSLPSAIYLIAIETTDRIFYEKIIKN